MKKQKTNIIYLDSYKKGMVEFQNAVEKHFEFLYDYDFLHWTITKDFTYAQDLNIKIQFYSELFCFEFIWYFGDTISILIKDLKEKNQLLCSADYKNENQCIFLVDVVNYLTVEKINLPLLEFTLSDDSKLRANKQKHNQELLNQNLEGIIAEYARLTQEYAGDILKGDLSVFAAVQAYAKKKSAEDVL